ncbi:MAG TPA: DUF202 domain-containing protein [Micromonosporaceae bacterium]|nr:DUF202 domain-containing protein [Micromonosporaceae bacterium]
MTSGEPDGLSRERTRLAWRRTALGGTAVALLAARLALTGSRGAVAVAVLTLVAVGWLALVATAFRRVRGMRAGRPPVARAVGLAALTVGFAGLGTALVVLA